MDRQKKIRLDKIMLSLSGMAFFLIAVPSWVPGMCCALLGSALWFFVVGRSSLPDGKSLEIFTRPGALLAGTVLMVGLGCNFYNDWLNSRVMQRAADILRIQPGALAFSCAAVLAAAALPAVAYVMHYFWTEAAEDYRVCCNRSKEKGISFPLAIAILFAVYTLGISAILRANVYYQDDAGRAVFGYKQWDYFGRFLSTALSTIVHADNYLADVAPLPQLLAMLILAFSGVMILYVLFDRTRFSLWELAAVIPLGLNPYFLECVSFRYDAPYMAVSVLCGVVPLAFRERKTPDYLFCAALGMIGVCTSYQAATGVFPMLAVLLALRMINEGFSGKQVGKFLLKSASGYILGLMIFKIALMRPASAGYVSNALPKGTELISHTFDNLRAYYSLVLSDFRPLWLMLAGLLAAGFIFVSAKKSRKSRHYGACAAVVVLMAMGLMCFGLYPVLKDTSFAPRAMYGFGIFLTLVCIAIAEGAGNSAGKLVVAALSWCFLVFSFTYGNALNLQREYTDFRIQLVIQDLNELDAAWGQEPISLRVSGSIGKSPLVDSMGGGGEMLDRLVPNTFDGHLDLNQFRFYYNYGLSEYVREDFEEGDNGEYPVVKDGLYHTIRADETHILVILK